MFSENILSKSYSVFQHVDEKEECGSCDTGDMSLTAPGGEFLMCDCLQLQSPEAASLWSSVPFSWNVWLLRSDVLLVHGLSRASCGLVGCSRSWSESRCSLLILPLFTAWLEQRSLEYEEEGWGIDWRERRCERLELGCSFNYGDFGKWQ